MPKPLSADAIKRVKQACAAGQQTASEALTAALGTDVALVIGEASPFEKKGLKERWDGIGLVIEFELAMGSVIALLPTGSEIFPEWFRKVEEANQEQLTDLARQLGDALLPEPPPGALAARVAEPLRDALPAFSDANAAYHLPITLKVGDETQAMSLLWETPLEQSVAAPGGSGATPSLPPRVAPARKRIEYEDLEDGIRQLPPLAKSLLKIKVPVRVTLASTKIPVHRVLDVGPGSILQFNKSCESPLSLEASDQEIAIGEAVKVGDKFGLWITSIAMPDERFWALRGGSAKRVK